MEQVEHRRGSRCSLWRAEACGFSEQRRVVSQSRGVWFLRAEACGFSEQFLN